MCPTEMEELLGDKFTHIYERPEDFPAVSHQQREERHRCWSDGTAIEGRQQKTLRIHNPTRTRLPQSSPWVPLHAMPRAPDPPISATLASKSSSAPWAASPSLLLKLRSFYTLQILHISSTSAVYLLHLLNLLAIISLLTPGSLVFLQPRTLLLDLFTSYSQVSHTPQAIGPSCNNNQETQWRNKTKTKLEECAFPTRKSLKKEQSTSAMTDPPANAVRLRLHSNSVFFSATFHPNGPRKKKKKKTNQIGELIAIFEF